MPVRIRYIGKPLLEQAVDISTMKLKQGMLKKLLAKEIKPNRAIMNLIGEEVIRGFQGGSQVLLDTLRANKQGSISYSRGSSYPYGIKREKSPDGAKYADLSPVTIELKKRKGATYINAILREMGHLVNGLAIRVYAKNDGVQIYFKDQKLNDKSWFHEEGRERHISELTKGRSEVHQLVKIPARPHREIQPAVIQKIGGILRFWIQRYR